MLSALTFVNSVIFFPLLKYFCKRWFSVSATIILSSLSIATSYGLYRSEATVIPVELHSAEAQIGCGVEGKLEAGLEAVVEVIVEARLEAVVEFIVEAEAVVEAEVIVDVEATGDVKVIVVVETIVEVEVNVVGAG